MLQKTIAVVSVYDEDDRDSVRDWPVQTISRQLKDVQYFSIDDVVTVSNKRMSLLAEEIEKSIRQCDLVLVLTGQWSAQVYKSVAKVFHQRLTSNGLALPKHARILGYSHTQPIVYVQGVLIFPNDDLELTFGTVLPFLQNYARNVQYWKSFIIHRAVDNGIEERLPCKDTVKVTYEPVDEQFARVTVKSSSWSSLLNYMDDLGGIEKDVMVERNLGHDISKLIYEQSDCAHIKNAIECIEECFEKYGPRNVFVCFNGGKDCTVLLHMTLAILGRKYPDIPYEDLLCLYIEHPNPFPEVQTFIAQCKNYYDLTVLKISKGIMESLMTILETRPNMKACLMGTRRTDPYSENLHPFQMTDRNWPQVMRVSPLLDWHYSEIWDYLLNLKVPYCCLYDMGYTSLGSVTNTVRNPALLCRKSGDDEVYLPAYKLLDASKERNGRKQT